MHFSLTTEVGPAGRASLQGLQRYWNHKYHESQEEGLQKRPQPNGESILTGGTRCTLILGVFASALTVVTHQLVSKEAEVGRPAQIDPSL